MTTIVQQLSHSGPLTFMIQETDPPGKEKLSCSSGNFQKRGRRDREGHWFLGRVQECGSGCRGLRLWVFNTWVSNTEINRLLYQGPKQKNYKYMVWAQERNNNIIRSLTMYACPLQNKKDYIKLFSSSLLQQHISVQFFKIVMTTRHHTYLEYIAHENCALYHIGKNAKNTYFIP